MAIHSLLSTSGEWLRGDGPYSHIVVSSRVRLARNLRSFPFPGWAKKHERLQTMREYMRMAFHRVPVSIHRKDSFTRLAHQLLAIPSRWRLDHDVYGLPLEIWLNQAARRVFKPLKPKVDAQQLSSEPVTC